MVQRRCVVVAGELTCLVVLDAIDRSRYDVFDKRPVLGLPILIASERPALPSDSESRPKSLAALGSTIRSINPMIRLNTH